MTGPTDAGASRPLQPPDPASHSASATEQCEAMRALLQTRCALLADVDPDERLLVRSDLTGTLQLYELADGELKQLTDLPEPVAAARYLPHTRQAVLEIDSGGNERYQLYTLELDGAAADPARTFGRLHPITTDPAAGHHFAGASPDGRLIAYVSNRGNGVDFDLWLCDVLTGEHRCVYAGRAYCQPASGFSPDGRLVSVLRPGDRPLDTDLVLVDVETGEARTVLEHDSEAALVGPPAWIDANSFCASSNAGRDFAAIVRHTLGSGATEPATEPVAEAPFDAEVVASADRSTLLVVENRGGASALRFYDAASGEPRETIPLPEPGVVVSHAIDPPRLSPDGSRAYFTLTTPRLAGDVFVHDRVTGRTRRLTTSPAALAAEELASAEATTVSTFDGEQIPLFVFRPPAGGNARPEARPPVVVVIHGGPEAQAMLSFNPVIQGLTQAGYGVIVPNVRGSTGYGKRFASLDDTVRRLDSVRDLEAVHAAIETHGFDPDRAALWGGSYGGYMVLAGLAFQPELWAAGVDIVGISDLVTFLENTSDYRRAHREREYGSLTGDRRFLAEASPLRHADKIRAPLFVIHGRNDPRVPVGEAQQLAENLETRGIRCETTIYEDEGHGLARLANRLDAYPRALAFLDDVLSPSA